MKTLLQYFAVNFGKYNYGARQEECFSVKSVRTVDAGVLNHGFWCPTCYKVNHHFTWTIVTYLEILESNPACPRCGNSFSIRHIEAVNAEIERTSA